MARVTTSVRLGEGINSLVKRAGYEPVDADGVNHNQDGTPIWVYLLLAGSSVALIILVIQFVYLREYRHRPSSQTRMDSEQAAGRGRTNPFLDPSTEKARTGQGHGDDGVDKQGKELEEIMLSPMVQRETRPWF